MTPSQLRLFDLLRHLSKLAICLLFGALGNMPLAHAANVLNGQNLYNNNCFVCHGPGGPNGSRGNRTAAQIAAAINTQPQMMMFAGKFTTADLEDIAAYLASPVVSAPIASISPGAFVFSATPVGQSSAAQSANVTNTGSAALSISSISFGGPAASDFQQTGGTCAIGSALAPGASCTIVVTFSPTASGTRSAVFTVSHNASGGSSVIDLQGVGGSAPSAAVYQGLWWNPNESGWGMSVTQHGTTLFVALFTYDGAGQPVWYVMSNCPLSGASCTGEIYKVSGGTSPAVPWNGAAKVVSSVGTGTLTFADADNGSLSYVLNSVSGSKSISRQIFASGASQPAIDYTDLWWNPDESGWGVALTQQFGVIFAAWYTYDAAGKPIWYVASSCTVSGSGCSGDLYQIAGGTALTSAWNGANKVVTKVGTVSFSFTDAGTGTMTYSINGVAGNRAIARQPF